MGMPNSGVTVETRLQVGTQQTWDLGFCGKIPSEDGPSKPNSQRQALGRGAVLASTHSIGMATYKQEGYLQCGGPP